MTAPAIVPELYRERAEAASSLAMLPSDVIEMGLMLQGNNVSTRP